MKAGISLPCSQKPFSEFHEIKSAFSWDKFLHSGLPSCLFYFKVFRTKVHTHFISLSHACHMSVSSHLFFQFIILIIFGEDYCTRLTKFLLLLLPFWVQMPFPQHHLFKPPTVSIRSHCETKFSNLIRRRRLKFFNCVVITNVP